MEKMSRFLKKVKIIEDDSIDQLSLKQRKEMVKEKLKENANLDAETIKSLLQYNNLDEELIVMYIKSLKPEEAEIELKEYSNFLSVEAIKDLEKNKLKKNLANRRKSFKSFFMESLFSLIKTEDLKAFNSKLNVLKTVISPTTVVNNQPHGKDNYEALYYYICTLFAKQVAKNSKNLEDYLYYLKLLISKFTELKKYYNEETKVITYEEEEKDFKKFMVVILAIINLDYSNYDEVSHVVCIFDALDDEEKEDIFSSFKVKNKRKYDLKKIDEFIRQISKENNYYTLDCEFVGKQLRLSEYSYLYEYITKNNIYTKHKEKLGTLLNTIFKSDLYKQIFRLLYNRDDKTYELIFENEENMDNFWKNVLIFVPFKLKRITGFSYRELPHIFISIYKICHFNTDLENELFTLGAFIRTLTHESLGHFVLSCIFFMFCARILDKKKYNSPRMSDKINELNKGIYFELVGKKLEEIEQTIINKQQLNEKLTNYYEPKNLPEAEQNLYNEVEKKLFDEFKTIIGDELSKKLVEKIIIREKDDCIPKIKIYQSEEIIDILFQYISEDFQNVISSLEKKKEPYKSEESGNLVEFLLYNDFSQNMNLKQCLFLLNEENYKETNLFKFRSAFKDIQTIDNTVFLSDLILGNKIFHDLFLEYNTLYEKDSYAQSDFVAKKTFKESCGNNLNTMYPAFQCFNVKTLGFIPPDYPEN